MAEAATETKPDTTATAPANGKPSGLWAKIAVAQGAVDRVGKDGTNTHHHYSYTRAEDVIRVASSAVNAAGLATRVSITETEVEPGQTQQGGKSLTVTVKGDLALVDPDTGEEAHFPLIGVGVDTPGDKAIYKAITGGTKYAWQMALQIAFGDDPEDDSTPGGKAEYRPAGNQELPAYAQPASEGLRQQGARAMTWLLGPEAQNTWADILAKLEVPIMPQAAVVALGLAIAARKRIDEGEPVESEPVPDEQPPDEGEPAGDALDRAHDEIGGAS